MNAPLSDLVEEEGEPPSLFLQLTSQLSLTELLAIMQGNFGAIEGMNRKLKDLLMKQMNQQDTAENRKKLADKEATKFKTYLTIPSQIQ